MLLTNVVLAAEPVVVYPSRMSVLGIQLRPVVPDGRFLGPVSGLSGHGVILTLGRRERRWHQPQATQLAGRLEADPHGDRVAGEGDRDVGDDVARRSLAADRDPARRAEVLCPGAPGPLHP